MLGESDPIIEEGPQNQDSEDGLNYYTYRTWTERCAEIRLWSEYTVEGDHVLATFDPLMHPTLTVTE